MEQIKCAVTNSERSVSCLFPCVQSTWKTWRGCANDLCLSPGRPSSSWFLCDLEDKISTPPTSPVWKYANNIPRGRSGCVLRALGSLRWLLKLATCAALSVFEIVQDAGLEEPLNLVKLSLSCTCLWHGGAFGPWKILWHLFLSHLPWRWCCISLLL